MADKEYIERGAFDRDLQNLVKEYNRNCESDKSSGAFEALYRLRLAPAADVVEVVHGEWIQNPHCKRMFYCSECDRPVEDGSYNPNPSEHFPYCHCGARMDGGKNDDK